MGPELVIAVIGVLGVLGGIGVAIRRKERKDGIKKWRWLLGRFERPAADVPPPPEFDKPEVYEDGMPKKPWHPRK